MFYMYNQNNTGGKFVWDKEEGIGHFVIIEADNPQEANHKAELLGLYWDGVEDGRDCPCCGDRWDSAYTNDGKNFPHIYGQPMLEGPDHFIYQSDWRGWAPDGDPEGYVHFKDGTVKPIMHERIPYEKK